MLEDHDCVKMKMRRRRRRERKRGERKREAIERGVTTQPIPHRAILAVNRTESVYVLIIIIRMII